METNFSTDLSNLPGLINLSSIWNSIPQQITDKLDLLIKLGEILTIIIIVYFLILIISKLMSLKDSHNLSTIAQQVTEINEKLSVRRKKSK